MKVLIYRGDTLHAEHELGEQPLRIGRSAENDIVLEDPGKGVSRHHAEIRPDKSGYALVDLGSQNGVWVAGSRVQTVRLEPGVAAAVGPYRLTVPEEVSVVPPSPAPVQPAAVETPAESRVADGRVVAGVGGLLGPTAETGPIAAIVLPPPPASPAPPVSEASAVKKTEKRDGASSTVRSPSTAKPASAGKGSQMGVFAVVAVLLLAAAAVGGYKLVRKQAPKAVWNREAATALVNQNRCAEALQQQIGPALAANPGDPDALALKAQCTPKPPVAAAAPPPVAAPPPPDPTSQALDAVDASLAAKDCKAALDAVNAVLATTPDNARATDLHTKAEDCVKAAAPARPAAPAVATAIPPAQGGLEVLPSETPQEYAKRVQAMKKQYDDAVALLQPQHYQQALKQLDAIAATVPAGYRDLAQRRSEARTALRDESGRQYAAGQQAEQNGDFAAAQQRYERAHELDPSRDVSGDIARLADQKARLGHDACTRAGALYLVGHNTEAAALYNKVVQLLPETDPCFKEAKDRLATIKDR